MSDFSHLESLAVKKDSTAEYEFFEIETKPTLICRCTLDNNGYQSAIRAKRDEITRNVRKRTKGKKERQRINDRILELLREPDREAFPGNVIIGWTTNKDAKGKEVTYSDENCADFLKALPDWLFDNLRLYCYDAQSFVDLPMDEDEEAAFAEN